MLSGPGYFPEYPDFTRAKPKPSTAWAPGPARNRRRYIMLGKIALWKQSQKEITERLKREREELKKIKTDF